MKSLIIIPTYNEAQNIGKLIDEINCVLKSYDFSILIVDDNSNDGTEKILEEYKEKYKNLIVMNRPSKMGLASAYIAGFMYGLDNNFDNFIQMDADFSHNPEYLPQMIKNFEFFDVVIGSRNIEGGSVVGWSPLRNFISKGGSLYSRIILGCKINDLTGGFNGWTRHALDTINISSIISKGFTFQIEMKYRAFKRKLKITEFPIVFEDRKFGESKMSGSIFLEALIKVILMKLFVH